MLKGENIKLRPLYLSDLNFLFEIENNTDNWKYGTENKEYTKTAIVTKILDHICAVGYYE